MSESNHGTVFYINKLKRSLLDSNLWSGSCYGATSISTFHSVNPTFDIPSFIEEKFCNAICGGRVKYFCGIILLSRITCVNFDVSVRNSSSKTGWCECVCLIETEYTGVELYVWVHILCVFCSISLIRATVEGLFLSQSSVSNFPHFYKNSFLLVQEIFLR